MKKVLVTGASGTIGTEVIKYLLSEGKYEITALDLKNKRTAKKFKNYKNRINVLYGDVNDEVLIKALIKDQDYVIHLASVIPPFGDFSMTLGQITEVKGTENIINAIRKENKDCYLLYTSTTSLYDNKEATIKDAIDKTKLSNFSLNKYNTELLIKKKLNNYVIFRIPLVLSNLQDNPFIYHVKGSDIVEVTTSKDVAYALVKAIDYKDKLNRKTLNVGMGREGRLTYNELLINILKNYGLSFKYIFSRIFLEKNYNSPILTDSGGYFA